MSQTDDPHVLENGECIFLRPDTGIDTNSNFFTLQKAAESQISDQNTGKVWLP